jgi:TetR/AcrR family transcriptional regulator, transcriptional repressor for nem operon
MSDAKEHILNTSFKLFLQKNFKEVTMREIVEKTGLSKGAFYHYFESKEQLFEEVVNHFFLTLTSIDFDHFSHASLADFCKDYLKFLAAQSEMYTGDNEDSGSNLFTLIFESMKIVPGFKKKFRAAEEKEIEGWRKIIKMARKSGEISSDMSDEEIAKIFIFINDGAGIRMIIDGKNKKMTKEIKVLWDGLYSQLKTR